MRVAWLGSCGGTKLEAGLLSGGRELPLTMGADRARWSRCDRESRFSRFGATPKFLAIAIAAVFLVAVGAAPAGAAAPTIVNQSSTGGQTNWLESFTVGNAGNADGHRAWFTVLVKHDPGRKVTGLRIDDNYDGTDNTGSETLRGVTSQQPVVVDGYNYSRVSYNYQLPTSNTGLDCGNVFSGGTSQSTKPLRIRAQLDNGQQTATSVSNIKWARTDCNAKDDMPYIYERSQTASSIEPGQSVTFTIKGDDTDAPLTGNRDFGGVSYRLRRLNDGVTTGETKVCWGNSDNTARSFTVNFPRRGRWVVEAEARNSNNNCDENPYNNAFYYIGAVDVNSAASDSPNLSLSATRPAIGASSTVTATFDDNDDNSEGGRVQTVEWDLDQNTGNGVSGYEDIDLGEIAGLSSPRTRTVDTSGMTPGLKTVRVRITDNGAMSGADNIRRTKTATTTIRVDSPPVAEDTDERTVTETALPITLSASDADADDLAYAITDQPDHGTLTGSADQWVYTPDDGYAGNDQISFSVDDGYGGTDTATVDIRVDPDIVGFSGPSGTLDSRGGQVEFGSRATGATFECSIDAGAWVACASPLVLTDLADGPHEARVRVTAGGLTNPDLASASWTADAYPHIAVNAAPDTETAMTTGSVDFSLSEDGSTVPPTAECKLDSHPWAPCLSPVSFPDLDDGPHQISIRATDAQGKQSTETVDWTVVTAGSDVAIDQPVPASITRDREATVHFSSTDPAAVFECSLDGAAWAVCGNPQDLTGLTDGPHTFKVRDQAFTGAESRPAQISWIVDRTAPQVEITSGPEGAVPAGAVAFEFEANEPFVAYECSFDGSPFAACSSPFTPGAEPADGNHTFRVAGVDRAGNRSLAAQRQFRVLSAAPAVQFLTGPAQGALLNVGSATFTFESTPATPGYECRVDAEDWYPCTSPAAVSGLADGQHDFAVRAVDEVGNRTVDPTVRTWSVDTTAPETEITSGPSGTVGEASAELAFQANEPGSTFTCSLDGAPFAPCGSPASLDGLDAGSHEFRVRARDAAGNVDQTPASRGWVVDLTPPDPPDPPEEEPEPDPCDFVTERVDCGNPFSVASIQAPFLRWKGGAKLKVRIDAGGSPLKRVASRFPIGTRLRVVGGKGRIGRLVLRGNSRTVVPLRLDGRKGKTIRVSAGKKPKVLLRPRTVIVENLPDGVTSLELKLFSNKGLRFRSAVCGTRLWRSVLTDWRSNRRDVNARTDVNCVKKGGRR